MQISIKGMPSTSNLKSPATGRPKARATRLNRKAASDKISLKFVWQPLKTVLLTGNLANGRAPLDRQVFELFNKMKTPITKSKLTNQYSTLLENHPQLKVKVSPKEKISLSMVNSFLNTGLKKEQSLLKVQADLLLSGSSVIMFILLFGHPMTENFSVTEKEAAARQLVRRIITGNWVKTIDGPIKANTRKFLSELERISNDLRGSGIVDDSGELIKSGKKESAVKAVSGGELLKSDLNVNGTVHGVTLSIFAFDVPRKAASIIYHLRAGGTIDEKEYAKALQYVDLLKGCRLGSVARSKHWFGSKVQPRHIESLAFRLRMRGSNKPSVSSSTAIGKQSIKLAKELSKAIQNGVSSKTEDGSKSSNVKPMGRRILDLAKTDPKTIPNNSKTELSLLKTLASLQYGTQRTQQYIMKNIANQSLRNTLLITPDYYKKFEKKDRRYLDLLIRSGYVQKSAKSSTASPSDTAKSSVSPDLKVQIMNTQKQLSATSAFPARVKDRSTLIRLLAILGQSKPTGKNVSKSDDLTSYVNKREKLRTRVKAGTYPFSLPKEDLITKEELQGLDVTRRKRIVMLQEAGYDILKEKTTREDAQVHISSPIYGYIEANEPIPEDLLLKLKSTHVKKILSRMDIDTAQTTLLKNVGSNPLVAHHVLPLLGAAYISKEAGIGVFGKTKYEDLSRNGIGMSKTAYRDVLGGKVTLSNLFNSLEDVGSENRTVKSKLNAKAAVSFLTSTFAGTHRMSAPEVLAEWDVSMSKENRSVLKDVLKNPDKYTIVRDAFHGTSVSGANCIISTGFRCSPEFTKVGRALGDVTYFAPNADKSMQYLGDRFSRSSTGILIVGDLILSNSGHNSIKGSGSNYVSSGNRFKTQEIGVADANKFFIIRKVYKVKSRSIAGDKVKGLLKNKEFHKTSSVTDYVKSLGIFR